LSCRWASAMPIKLAIRTACVVTCRCFKFSSKSSIARSQLPNCASSRARTNRRCCFSTSEFARVCSSNLSAAAVSPRSSQSSMERAWARKLHFGSAKRVAKILRASSEFPMARRASAWPNRDSVRQAKSGMVAISR
jgi:hypothetical protein